MLFTSLLLAGTFLSAPLIASIPVVQIFAWLGMACSLAGLAVNLWIVPALLSEWWGRQKKVDLTWPTRIVLALFRENQRPSIMLLGRPPPPAPWLIPRTGRGILRIGSRTG